MLNRFRNVPALVWVVGLAVVSHILAAIYFGDSLAFLPIAWDQISYDMMARQVADAKCFRVVQDWWPVTRIGEPTAHWSYLYTLYLAAVYKLVGFHPLAGCLIQALLVGILLPLGTSRLAERCVG